MPQTNLVLRILTSQQALLEIELQTLFGLQVDDVFPSEQEGETILSFRTETDQQPGENAPLQTYLERQKAAGVILEMAPAPKVNQEPDATIPMLRVQPGMVYAFDEQRANEFDAARSPSHKRFALLLPGSNAYLLEFDDFEPLKYPHLDPGDPEPGCFVSLDPTLSKDQRQRLLVGLVAQGYALSLFPGTLLLTAWHREVLTETVNRDIQRILSTPTPATLKQLQILPPTIPEVPAYPITSLEAGDLRSIGFTDEEVAQLSESLPEIARKMADVYLESRYWDDLRFFARNVLERLSPRGRGREDKE